MAELTGIPADAIDWATRWYLREDTLRPANFRPVRPGWPPVVAADRQAHRQAALAVPAGCPLPAVAARRAAPRPPRPGRPDRRALGRPAARRGVPQAGPRLGRPARRPPPGWL